MDDPDRKPKIDEGLLKRLELVDIHNDFKDEWKSDPQKIQAFIRVRMRSVLPDYGETFGSYLNRLKEIKGLNNKELADRTGLSDSCISKYLHDSGRTENFTLALMIAFELEPPQIDAVSRLAGIRIDQDGLKFDTINHYIEHSTFSNGINSVAECNNELILFGFEPLTTIGTDEYYK